MKKKSSETTRERIIQASIDTFDRLDFHQATIREIAKKCQIAPASIYTHFDSKDELAVAITTEKMKQMISGLEEHLLGITGTLNKIRKMTFYYFNYFETYPRVAWVIYISTSVKSWCESVESLDIIQQTGNIFRQIILEGQNLGEVNPNLNIYLAINIYFGGLARVIGFWLARFQKEDMSNYAEDFTQITWAFIKKPEEKSPKFLCPIFE